MIIAREEEHAARDERLDDALIRQEREKN